MKQVLQLPGYELEDMNMNTTISIGSNAVMELEAGVVSGRVKAGRDAAVRSIAVSKETGNSRCYCHAILESRRSSRLENVGMAILAALGFGSVAWGLSLGSMLATEWPRVEAALNAIIR